MFVGLVHDPGRRLPEEPPGPPDPDWKVPYRLLARLLLWCVLLAVAPTVGDVAGPLAGYAVLLLAVTLGLRWVERWCARQYWSGLRDFRL